jgi:hypothetical protein
MMARDAFGLPQPRTAQEFFAYLAAAERQRQRRLQTWRLIDRTINRSIILALIILAGNLLIKIVVLSCG